MLQRACQPNIKLVLLATVSQQNVVGTFSNRILLADLVTEVLTKFCWHLVVHTY